MGSIQTALQTVKGRISSASMAAGAPATKAPVALLAVSKTFGADAVREALAAGQHAFGENYVQEALAKIQALADVRTQVQWHFIGPIQSNKTRDLAANFDWVHSVSRLNIAQRLASQRPAHLPPLNLCLQVNTSAQASKSGAAPGEVVELARAIAALPASAITLRGLMAIPEPASELQGQRAQHRPLRELFEVVRSQLAGAPGLAHWDTLSMGMSADMEAAIAEGATVVRVGSAIFGARH